ncbi:MAG: DNA polymerase IV [Rothia sp. (in: high G+C Gram-positive bacteria)]|nr:DNA polymerase IV [Rothia sp. (in: high G+C Gram-positive bacteria)]
MGAVAQRTPIIMHLDMDAFFVNVELLARPQLRGQKIIVAREAPRSVVLSASYEARRYGVGSAMPLARAKQLCPDAVLVEPAAHYREYSRRVMGILRQVTDRVEQVSVDEAFVDLTGAVRTQGNPVDIAQGVRDRIAQQLQLPSSVGISSTKFIAKMASTGSKPNGLWVVPPHRVQEFLDPMPVGKLWGVGKKSAAALEGLGIHTVKQLTEYELPWLQAKFGRAAGAHYYNMARGIDPRPVVTERTEKSIGAEHTFDVDVTGLADITQAVYHVCLKVAKRLRAAGRQARTLSLKIRFSDFETLTRSCPLEVPTQSGKVMYEAAMQRLAYLGITDGQGCSVRPLRLLGVRAEKLESIESGVQLVLPAEGLAAAHPHLAEHWNEAEHAMDRIHGRYGSKGLLPARLLVSDKKT